MPPPDVRGLVSCICVQFTGVATYHSAALQSAVQVPVTVNDYGQLVGNDGPWKLFSGVINWFFCAAQTIQNRQGHLLSDMAGTKQAVENQRSGAGLPGGFLSTLEELSTLPCMQDAKFSWKLRSAYMNGIGTKESQVDLGVLNSLFISWMFGQNALSAIISSGRHGPRCLIPYLCAPVILSGSSSGK